MAAIGNTAGADDHRPTLPVPRHFYEALSSRLLTNSFLARVVILECRRRGAGRDDTERPFRKCS